MANFPGVYLAELYIDPCKFAAGAAYTVHAFNDSWPSPTDETTWERMPRSEAIEVQKTESGPKCEGLVFAPSECHVLITATCSINQSTVVAR